MSRMNKKEQILKEEEALEMQENALEPAPEASEGSAPAESTPSPADVPAVDIAKLQQDLEAATGKAEEYLSLAQRVQADFDNFRRRNESVRSDAFGEGQRAVASAMLPVLDNLERALDAAAAGESEALKNGVELVLKQMRDVYHKYDVTPIDRLGEKFDPNLENAIMQGAPEDGDPGTVCQVLQKGYRMGAFVLRHAMVKVVPD